MKTLGLFIIIAGLVLFILKIADGYVNNKSIFDGVGQIGLIIAMGGILYSRKSKAKK